MKALLLAAFTLITAITLGCGAPAFDSDGTVPAKHRTSKAAEVYQLNDKDFPQPKKVPEGTVEELYADEGFLAIRNFISTDMLQRLSSCFTPALIDHFESHNRKVTRWMEDHAGQSLKLPMTEGPIFTSNYEGADGFNIEQAEINDSYAEVPVSLWYSDGEDAVQWIDIVKLRLVDGFWLVNDIQFDPERWKNYTLRKRVALEE